MDYLTIVLIALMLAVLVQPTIPRAIAAMVFASLSVVHDIAFSDLNGLAYYGSAALFDLIVILILNFTPLTKLSIRLQLISSVSISLNFIGWIMWTLYLPPDAYNAAFIVLYLVSALALIIGSGGDDMGDHALDRRWFGFRRHDNKGRSFDAGIEGKL